MASPVLHSQWKNHSTRTGIVTGLYIGGIAAACSSGDSLGSGSNYTPDNTNQNRVPNSAQQPNPEPGNGGKNVKF